MCLYTRAEVSLGLADQWDQAVGASERVGRSGGGIKTRVRLRSGCASVFALLLVPPGT